MTTIPVNVRLTAGGRDGARAEYSSPSQAVNSDGDISLSQSRGVPKGPVRLQFTLTTRRLKVDGETYSLRYPVDGRDAILIGDGDPAPSGGPQFRDFSVGRDGSVVEVVDQNDDCKSHRYCLQVDGRTGSGATRRFKLDPVIENRPPNEF